MFSRGCFEAINSYAKYKNNQYLSLEKVLFMNTTVRLIKKSDIEEWVRMRNLLWPGSPEDHIRETNEFFSEKGFYGAVEVFVAENPLGKVIGFVELNIRSVVDGAASGDIPYVEGWYVDENHRNRGVGKLLINEISNWAVKKGYSEIGSDTELDNNISIQAHKALGFKEADRKICFIKTL